jgi:aspartyl-tRNA(Asn)/glutamyl-tRNA(Gln) amidotransferase subunit C
MKIDRNLVLQIARLARIELTDTEVDTFAPQLETILEYIAKLNEVSESAEPFAPGEWMKGTLRPDTPVPSLPVEDALKNAPDRRRTLFRVPRVIP